MEYSQLGDSDLTVSRICLGTAFRSEPDLEIGVAAIHAAADVGCNYLDTANFYRNGHSEEIIGHALRGRRDKYIVSSKVGSPMQDVPGSGGLSHAEIMRASEASLRRLGTDYMDCYVCHFPDEQTPLEETFRALDELVQQGKVRHVGVSRFEGWRLNETLGICNRERLATPVCNQVGYSLLDRRLEDEVIPFCLRRGVGVTLFATTGIGLLNGGCRYGQPPPAGSSWDRGPYNYRAAMTAQVDQVVEAVIDIAMARNVTPSQVAMAWCLAVPGITSVITGADSAERVQENCLAAELKLTANELDRLDRVSAGHRLEIRKDCPEGYEERVAKGEFRTK